MISSMTLRMTAKVVVKHVEPKVRQQCGWPLQGPKTTQPRQVERPVVLVIEEKPEIVSPIGILPTVTASAIPGIGQSMAPGTRRESSSTISFSIGTSYPPKSRMLFPTR